MSGHRGVGALSVTNSRDGGHQCVGLGAIMRSHDSSPVLAYRREGSAWCVEGSLSFCLGNQSEAASPPFQPSAGWRTDGEAVTVWSDRHGFVPIYYYDGDRGFGVSCSWVALQQWFGLSRLDDEAIACYLRLGHYLGDDTAFAEIRRMPPDSTLSWRDGRVRLETRQVQAPRGLKIGWSEAVIEYGRRFADAIARICQMSDLPRISLISGGQDSRHILVAMIEAGFAPQSCLTQVPQQRGDEDDAKIAARLCQSLGLDNEQVPAAPVSIHAEARKNLQLGMDSTYHAWLLPLATRLDAMPRGLVFDGLGGDTLSASRFLTDDWITAFREERLRDAAGAYIGAEGYLPKILKREWAERWRRELVADRLECELSRFADWPNPQAAFQLRHRTRRAIAPNLWRLLARSHAVALPYFEPEVFDFLISLPMEMLTGRRFHLATIQARYPSACMIPFSRYSHRPMHPYMQWPSRHVLDTMRLAATPTLSRYVKPIALHVRAIRGFVSPSYEAMLPALWSPAVYLAQLAALVERPTAGVQRPASEPVAPKP